MKRLFIIAFLFLSVFVANAQHIRAYAEYDYNRTEHSRANFAIGSDFQLADNFRLDLGLLAGTQNRFALNVAYQIDLHQGK
jgi:hypothetical protein